MKNNKIKIHKMSDNYVIVIYIDKKNSNIYLEKSKWSNKLTTDIINPREGDLSKNVALNAVHKSGFKMEKLYSCFGQYVCVINPYSYYFLNAIPNGWIPFKFEEILQSDDRSIDKGIKPLLQNFQNLDNKEIDCEYTW